ncbi:hypothetical protein [Streptomyces sp. ICBB 8177]|uniref:hypothetical protein n=1 Tax=Streptomyces sp. ICBB 8177 TaxID=563922 RepID=UPI000D673956|nr:hypothetical protein [Streptomyces sp. ICBB 8177]PWI41429.1 hypothetical protein CK485_21255 [Streptomyces sp. ICBB 8177]
MAESVPVRCPACRREHAFTPPTFPCPCGAPLTLPLLRGGMPTRVLQRTWRNSWITLRCPACGRSDDWPQPELGCACGAVIRPPVDVTAPESLPAPGGRATATAPRPVRRPPFRPVTIRTGRDAVAAAAQYLKWLGFREVTVAADRAATGVDLRGEGLVAQVDPSTRATPLREVETLWLNCLNEDAAGAFFSLAGYAHDARLRADQLLVPLFVMDLTGTPQPVNDAADQFIRSTPGRRR